MSSAVFIRLTAIHPYVSLHCLRRDATYSDRLIRKLIEGGGGGGVGGLFIALSLSAQIRRPEYPYLRQKDPNLEILSIAKPTLLSHRTSFKHLSNRLMSHI